ncbi:MAG: adenosylmethionine--8-amino-7-oxononanoate transaminase [Planctomycetota bacterium]|nr:MAG: adenosylmethionine--8-amino-7-oxononanoate transaminase [Planctomycetota bacterium]
MAKYLERDKKYLWHPFTQMKDWMGAPQVVIAEGRGEILTDVAGKKYIDGVSSLWCNVHGHRNKKIDAAVKRQIDAIAHSTMLGLTHVKAIELAERLIGIAPRGLTRVFYSDSGAESTEIALKMAFQYWQHRGGEHVKKTRFVALTNAYHGDTIGAVSVGGIDLFHSIFRPLLFSAYFAPAPYCYRCPLGKDRATCKRECLKELEELLEAHAAEIAAMIIEPLVQGAGGMIMAPRGYLAEVRRLCTKYNVLMIADEVAMGFGRTGRMFACEHEGVAPDFLCLAKGITGGYLPLAATLATEEVFDRFLGAPGDHKTFFHGHTYTGNPLACAAALAGLDVFEEEKVLENLQPKIARLSGHLERFRGLDNVGDARQCGMVGAIELVADRESGERFPEEKQVGVGVCLEARRRGLLIRPLGDTIVIFPPLCISNENLDKMMNIIYDSVCEVCGD